MNFLHRNSAYRPSQIRRVLVARKIRDGFNSVKLNSGGACHLSSVAKSTATLLASNNCTNEIRYQSRNPGHGMIQTRQRHLHQHQQSRDVSLFKFPDRMKLARLKQNMEANPSDATMQEYLNLLVTVDPSETISFIERGWSAGKVHVNEDYLKLYFRAAAELRRIDAINISGLLSLLMKSKQQRAGDSSPAAELESIFIGSMHPGMGSGSARPMFGAGSSPASPLFIAQQERSWKKELWSTLRTGIGLFILFSFIGTFFDDKGTSTSASGAGGISARMSMSGQSVIHRAEKSDKTFNDVVGIDEAKADLQEVVHFLKDPRKFTRLGGKLPKGCLLTGPPGTGKTLLARAIAGEAHVPFFHASGSEFEEMYVGVGAKRVRELFETAKANSPCIIFIDEIDAIGGSRHVKDQSAMKMTLNQLLVELDGFAQNDGIIVIGATNFADSLDKALIRPGRFDKIVDVPTPDIGGRKAILELYAKKIPLQSDVDLEQIARGTPGFSGAELFNLMNQAALKASVENQRAVGMHALEYAKDKILMGAERKTAVISAETMRTTAFHEAGHALVALLTDGADPIHKATIMPRGRALGMVMQLPDGDQTSMSRKQMLARLDVCMGGRVAEELVFGASEVTSGASNDIMQATKLARAMVTKYGFSDKVGVLFVDEKEKKHGSGTQSDIDEEVKALLQNSYTRATNLLKSHRKELDLIAQGLMDYELLAGSEIVDIINGKPPSAGKARRSQAPSRATKALPPRKTQADVVPSSSSSIKEDAAAKAVTSSVSVAASGSSVSIPADTVVANATLRPPAPPASPAAASTSHNGANAVISSSKSPSDVMPSTAAAAAKNGAAAASNGANAVSGTFSSLLSIFSAAKPAVPPSDTASGRATAQPSTSVAASTATTAKTAAAHSKPTPTAGPNPSNTGGSAGGTTTPPSTGGTAGVKGSSKDDSSSNSN